MLRVTGRSFFAAFAASTPISKMWASSTTSPNSTQVCPTCGTCQQCNTKAGKCGQDCEDPCTAATLCSTAEQYSPYQALQSFLAGQFISVSEPEALVLVEPSVSQTAVLSTQYTGSDPTVTAKLYFTTDGSGFNAYGVRFQNGTPQYGYFVGVGGQIQQVLPPYQGASNTLSSSAGSATGISATSTIMPGITNSPFASQTTNKQRCTAICELTCNAVFDKVCDKLEAAGCADAALISPFASLICYLAVVGVCQLAGNTLCPNICAAECECGAGEQPCGTGCCGTCQSCSNGQCVPMQCPAGYSCSSTTGTCTCENFCGSTCCYPGQMCSLGVCTGCPTGLIACGSTCCPTGQVCTNGQCANCPVGQTICGTICCGQPGECINGQCAMMSCPSGMVPCGRVCIDPSNGPCCPGNANTSGESVQCYGHPGYICCSFGGCCPPGEQCCENNGVQCCGVCC